jgi:uncharacterized protein YpiB (UPF0302 family)
MMMSKDAKIKEKIEVLLYFIKAYGVRDPVALGLVFMFCNEEELLQKGIYLDDLTLMSMEPVLLFGYDPFDSPTMLVYKGVGYRNPDDIFHILQNIAYFYIYVDFPEEEIPYWYLGMCQPNPLIGIVESLKKVISEVENRVMYGNDYRDVYREAIMVLINCALEQGDKNQFYNLSKEWNRIDL